MPPRDVTGPKPRKKVRVRRKAPKRTPLGQNAPPAPKVVRRAKPAAGPPTGLSERDRVKVKRYERQTTTAAKKAKQGKPFNAEHLRNAIASGKAHDVKETNGVFTVKRRRKFLPDDAVVVRPKTGAKFDPQRGNGLGLTRKEQTVAGMQVAGDAVHAPALKVLEATAYPSHKIAGLAGGKNFGEVYRKAGLPKPLAGVAGFATDVVTDPTTYLTLGTASVARKAALDTAEATARRAAKAGMSESAQKTVAQRAAKRAETNAREGKGVTVKFAGAEVPGVRSATAAVGRTVRKTPVPKFVKKVGAGAREAASEFRPTLTPKGANAETYASSRQQARSTRSFVHRHIAHTEAQARGLKDQIGEKNYPAVIDAVERGKIGKLPDELRKPAVALRSANRHAKRLRKRAGIPEGEVGKARKIRVPQVTADVQTSHARLSEARAELARQERLHTESLAGFGVARGRAQILSRNVGGAKAEQRAQALTVPEGVAQFAGGGHGVRQAASALQAGSRNLAKARENVRRLEAEHEGVVATARQQRVARGRALKAKERGKGAATGYFTHARETDLHEGLGIIESAAEKPQFSGSLRSPGSAKKRQDLRPISEQNPERIARGDQPFSTDIPLVHINYGRQTARSVAAGELEKRLGEVGRVLKPKLVKVSTKGGKKRYRREYAHHQLKDNESVFHVGYAGKGSNFSLREITPKDWDAGNVPTTGKLVALDRRSVEAARQYGRPTQATSKVGRGFDKATRGFKITATATPGFHVRNLIGDTQLAYLSQPGHRLPVNIAQAAKAVKGLNAQQRAVEDLATHTSEKTIKVGTTRMKIDEFLDLAREHGVLQTGQITGELRDLGGKAVRGVAKAGRIKTATRKAGRVVFQNRAVKALTQDRENLVRLSTFKHGLDKGLKPNEAADLSLNTHIDYADLTEVERKYGRRLMPFYTFSARALPFQAKKLATNPGKFATIEKAREEIGGTDVSGFSDYQQRQVPVIVGGKAITAGLPVTLLNEIPTTTKPGEYGTEIGQFLASLSNPVAKFGPELYANKNFTFRDDIEPPDRPLVSAPGWVSIIPEGQRKHLGIVQGPDKRTGKQVWLWPGKLDYKVRAVMVGPLNQFNQLSTDATNRAGQGRESKALSAATGIRVQTPDKVSQQINTLYKDIDEIDHKLGALNQQGVKSKNATAEYRALQKDKRLKQQQIFQLAKKRGDKTLPTQGAPRKARVTRPSLGGGLGGGGLGGGVGGGIG